MWRETVLIRAVRSSDMEAVREVYRSSQVVMSRQEFIIHLLRLFKHPYLVILTVIIFLLLYCILQDVVWAAVWGVWVVVVLEGSRYWMFWRQIRRVFQPGPDLLNLMCYYSHSRRLFLVAEVDGEIVGTAAVRETDDPYTAKLMRMFVHPRFRRKNIASRLVEACHSEADHLGYKAVELLTHTTNHSAIKCYLKAGYTPLYVKNFARLYPHTFDTIHFIWKIK
ncbi:N-acetylaspartate synthetase [Cherax quadricarinatus]